MTVPECDLYLCCFDSVPPLASVAAHRMVLLRWCETKRIAFVKVYSLQFSLISPGIGVLNYMLRRTPHSYFFTRPRLLGKQALHMSPAMTVFTVKDFDLYFYPSPACTPLRTSCVTRTHTHADVYNHYHPSPIPTHSASN